MHFGCEVGTRSTKDREWDETASTYTCASQQTELVENVVNHSQRNKIINRDEYATIEEFEEEEEEVGMAWWTMVLWDIFNSQHLGERILKDFFGRDRYWMVVVGIGQVVGNTFHSLHRLSTYTCVCWC